MNMRKITSKLTIPSVTVVTVVPILIVALSGCPAQTAPGACFSGWAPPAGTPAMIVNTATRPTVSLDPCPARSDGINPSCLTAQGCTVFYNVANGQFPANVPAELVVCPANGQCLWGVTQTGASVLGACPSTDQPNTLCSNELRLDKPRLSGFLCQSPMTTCTMPSSEVGMRIASVRRYVTGEVNSSACPTPCQPYA